jgi:hypothetical protein
MQKQGALVYSAKPVVENNRINQPIGENRRMDGWLSVNYRSYVY